jgi:hypothetical protein
MSERDRAWEVPYMTEVDGEWSTCQTCGAQFIGFHECDDGRPMPLGLVIRSEQAKALREAANHAEIGSFVRTPSEVAAWLRARADALDSPKEPR